MINRKLGLEDSPYCLKADQGKAFGYHKVFINNILEQLWKEPELIFYIILKCDIENIRDNLSSFIVNNFFDNILSSSYMEVNLLYLLALLLKDEVNQLNEIGDIDKFLSGTKCGFLFDQLFKQNDIQVFFKAILLKTVEKLEVLNSNRKIIFDVGLKEKELIKYKDNFKKENAQKGKKINKLEIYKEIINNIIFENFSCNRMDLIDNLSASKIDHETFISKYIPDLGVKELNNRINECKDKNDKIITYYKMQIEQIEKKENPNLFSNKSFMLNLQTLKLSVHVLSFYQTDFALIVAYIEEIFKNLIDNINLLPYSVKSLCKIISILITNKFPDINEIQKNAYISCFFFGKLLIPILSNPAVNALIGEFIISGNTLHNLNLISNIILKLTSGNLFQDNNFENDFTPFNWFFLDKMSSLITFFGHITKVSLPDFIDKLVNDKLEKNYRFNYFVENPDEVVTLISICYNTDNLVTILECIENNKTEIFNMVNDDSRKLFSSSFQRLYKPENIEKIKSFGLEMPDLNKSVYNNLSINKDTPTMNYFLFTKRYVNDKYKILFDIDANLYQNFHLKEIEEPKNKDDINKNVIIKVKNYISNSLYNYRILEKNDFEEGTTNNTFQIFRELKRFMKSSNFIVDNSIPSIWYINSLLSYLKRLPPEYQENDYAKLYKELKEDIINNIENLDFQSLILFHSKLKYLSRATKHYKVAKKLVADIDINEVVKKIVEEVTLPVEVYFKYDDKEKKLKIEKSKLKLLNDNEYIEDPKRGLILKTIEVFTKKFPNLVRHQYFQGADFFEMLGEIELPKKLNNYFEIIEKDLVKRRVVTQSDFNKLKNQLIEYVMNRLYEKIYPQEPSMDDSQVFKKCVMLSWAEPKYFINKKTNYVYDSFLPDVISHFKQIHSEKTPRKKMECIKSIFVLINNVIKFNDREGECGADDSTSILTYSLVQAQPFCIYSDLKFVELFYQEKMFKIEGNQLTQLLSACNLVCQLNGKSFNMDENEFMMKCQEVANNPNNDDDAEN